MNLRTNHLSLAIGSKILFQSLNLTISKGEVFGILGPNGCGKTTLLKTLANLNRVKGGGLYLNNSNYRKLSAKEIARKIGILMQDTHLTFAQTVGEYCATSRYPHLSYSSCFSKKDEEIVITALKQMHLEDKYDCSMFALSGGEKRRVAIAALLAQTPQIFLLDEPTNHLDVHYQSLVLKHFRYLAQKKEAMVVMSLHDMNHAEQYCDKILLLFADGSFLHGSRQEILTAANLSKLYQHPIELFTTTYGKFWQAI